LRYRTKVDTWLVAVLAGALMLPIAIGVVGYLQTGASAAMWLPLGIAGLVVIIVCLLAVPTYYEVTPDRLLICSGFLRWEVPRADIVSITPTTNPLSSPAWSLDRLEITWTRQGSVRSILISPQRREEFLREMQAEDDDQLRRSSHQSGKSFEVSTEREVRE
jgi:membrane protein YdbS with pleckstrin-like domain